MANINQILKANHGTYNALKDVNSVEAKIDDFELIQYKHDKKSDHGAVAYYSPIEKTVLIAHRGSATFKDWMVNNPKIAKEVLGKPLETMADVQAKRFTNNVLELLDRGGNEIDLVISSGHSKGGRESSHALIEIADNLKLNNMGLTFNSAPIKHHNDNQYNHVNLRLSGGNFYNSDVVSVLGNQLGENYKVISQKITNPITAHSLNSFSHIQNENKAFTEDQLNKIFDHVKSGKEYSDYISSRVTEKFEESNLKNTIYSIPNVVPATEKVIDMKDSNSEISTKNKESFLSTLDENRKSIAEAVIVKMGGYSSFSKYAEGDKQGDNQLSYENYAPSFKDFKERIIDDAKNNGYETPEDYLKDQDRFKHFEKADLKASLNDENINDVLSVDDKTINDIHNQILNYSVESTIFDHQYYENLENAIANENGYNLTVVLSEDKEIHVIQQGAMDREAGEATFNYDEQNKAEVMVIGQVDKIENFLELNQSKLQTKLNQIQQINASGSTNNTLKGLEVLAKNRLNIVKSEMSEVKSFQSAHGVIVGQSEDKLYMLDKDNNLYDFNKHQVVNKEININKLIEEKSKVEFYNDGKNTRIYSVDNKTINKESFLDNSLHNKTDEKQKSSFKSKDGLQLD